MPLEMLRGSPAPCRAVCGTSGCFRTMNGDVSAPSCCAFTHRAAFEEVSGHRVLIQSGLGDRVRSACGTTHGASLDFPRETGLILRCAGKAENASRPRRGIDSPVAIRRGEGAQKKRCRDPWCSPRGNPACQGTFAVASRVSSTVSHLRTEHGTSLETPGISVFPWSETGKLGNFGVASRVPSSISNFKMERGTSLETLAGKGLILR